MASIVQALQRAAQRLDGSDSPRLDAEVLLMHVLGKPRSYLHAWPERELEAGELAAYEALTARRSVGEPVAHLTGQREFWSLALEVTPDTLIPRPETETLVEQALQWLPEHRPLRIADLGTGSGAMALALASERRHWLIYALDRSAACVSVARRNARRLEIANCRFLIGHWTNAFGAQSLDAIVSNPPYVGAADPHLHQGDVRYEPRTALAAGADGLDDIRQLVDDAARVLVAGGPLLLEHAPWQAQEIRKLFKKHGYTDVCTARDAAGRERVTGARLGR
jgi:release factor glutamine methyltransferase